MVDARRAVGDDVGVTGVECEGSAGEHARAVSWRKETWSLVNSDLSLVMKIWSLGVLEKIRHLPTRFVQLDIGSLHDGIWSLV